MTPAESDSSTTQEGMRQVLDRLAEHFFAERRAGSAMSIEQFAAQHPAQADDIRKVFPALVRLERMGGGARSEEASNAPLARLGEYRILREVGRGGMGVVYEATQGALDRRVALKVLPPQATLDQRYLERFRREAQAAASLQHPNIVPVFGAGEEAGVHFIAMQYVEGKGLDRVLDELRRWRRDAAPESLMSPPTSSLATEEDGGDQYFSSVARVGLQLTEALAHAHARGVLHRDVKPSNVLLDGTGKPWIADFGLAQIEESADLTLSGDVVGTLRYLAPERLAGVCDARADVYGLGMTLYELLTLRPAFEERDRAKLVKSVAQEMPTRPRRVDRRIPQDLESIVLKATEKVPELRYSSAEELAVDLRAFLERRPVTARPPSVAHLLRLAVGRNRPLSATVALAAVVLVSATSAYVVNLQRARAGTESALRDMRAQALVSASVEAASSDARLALLLAREAVGLRHNAETLSRLQHAAAEARERATFSHGGELVTAALAPRGDAMLVGSFGVAFLLDLEGNELLRLPIPGWVSAVGFSTDGERLLAASRGGAVRVWDRGGEPLAALEHEGSVGSACFSPDDRWLLTASSDRSARVWRADGSEGPRLEHPAEVLSASFDTEGDRIGTACADGTARVWSLDPETGMVDLELLLEGHQGQVSMVSFSAGGERILTSSCVSVWRDPAYGDETARLWDASGELIAVLAERSRRLQFAGFFPDGERVLGLFTNGKVRIWDDDGKPLFEGHNPVRSPAWFPGFSADGRRFAVGCVDGGAWLFGDEARVVAPLPGHEADVFATLLAPDGETVVTVSSDGTVRVWDASVLPEFHGHGAAVYSAVPSPDGGLVVTASEDWTARLWEASGKPVAILAGHEAYVRSAEFSPDGRLVLTSSRDGTARLWDLEGNVIRIYEHEADTGAASFAPGGEEFATVCRDRTVTLWSLDGIRLERFLVPDWPTSVRFSPDGEMLVVAAGKEALLCTRDGEVLRRFAGHEGTVTSARFSPGGQSILTASTDTTARLWSLATEDVVMFRGHLGGLHQAAFSPLGDRIVTASEDDSIRVWSLDGQALSVLHADQGLHSAVFTSDGSRILSASWTGSARTWLTDPEEILALAERRAYRDFTVDELIRYERLLDAPAYAAGGQLGRD